MVVIATKNCQVADSLASNQNILNNQHYYPLRGRNKPLND